MKKCATPKIMGIVNVTPDSFYDGGHYSCVHKAIDHIKRIIDDGVDIIDIGGASSRPGAEPVSIEEELRRIIPVIEAAAKFFNGPISVDTTWSVVARAACEAGAAWINDISAGRFDSNVIDVVAETGCKIILMHSRGTPQTMQTNPDYEDVVGEVVEELTASVNKFKAGGVADRQILIDPGIGFAKSFDHNIALMKNLACIVALGYPVVIGTSRKSFIGTITGKSVQERLSGSLATVAAAWRSGVEIYRVHDVAETADFMRVLSVVE